ncbi:unnamed protein product, partial [marine sediment metagenome]
HQFGDIVFVELPEAGMVLKKEVMLQKLNQ